MRLTLNRPARLAAWLLILGMVPGAVAQEIFRHVDEKGRITFSDRPHNGGEKVTLPPTNRSSAMSIPDAGPTQDVPDTRATEREYQGIRIAQPPNDMLIRDNAGNLSVVVQVIPALRDGDRIRLLLDGGATGEDSTNSRLQITNVDRGSHQLQAQVLDKNDKVVLESEAITVHLMRRSIRHTQQK